MMAYKLLKLLIVGILSLPLTSCMTSVNIKNDMVPFAPMWELWYPDPWWTPII